mmetsp:Transcript_64621/g.173029  ORF Transcript_64621/g.173029 Transcript_64621/m.173029 type:complete len:930 (-) Transcript_64621:16-2805(-)
MQLAAVLIGAAAAAQPVALMSEQVNRSNSWTEVSEAHAAVRRALAGWSWQRERPHFDAAMDRVPLETMLKHVGDQIPPRVLAALRKHKGDGPESLSEDELNHARGVINGMMEGQVTQLDITVVQCKELRERSKLNLNVVAADLSRLGSKLAKEKKRILNAQAGIEEAQQQISNSRGMLLNHKKMCTRTVNNLQSQLKLIKLDLDAANLVVKLTACSKKSFLQGNSTAPELKACSDDREAVISAGGVDVKLQSPSATLAFDEAFEASTGPALEAFVAVGGDGDDGAVGDKVRGYVKAKKAGSCQDKNAAGAAIPGCAAFATSTSAGKVKSPQECGAKCAANALCKSFEFVTPTTAGFPGDCYLKYATCNETKNAACFQTTEMYLRYATYTSDGTPPLAVGGAKLPKLSPSRTSPPAAQQAFKCTVVKPDCGLMHDNMSIFYGEVKDKYDAKYAELAAEKQRCLTTESSINQEIALWNALLQERNTELGDATAEQSEATQTQTNKLREQRALNKDFKAVDTKCKTLVGEFMMNLCGLRKVRGELAKFSQGSMKPEKIFDCVVTDWRPQECSASCVGGKQLLTRAVSQLPTLGIKCPPLQMVKKCNEFPCPIDCQMASWSKWGRCTKECGGGLQARVRNIKRRPNHGGKACPAQTETQQCNVASCDADCKLSKWSSWKACNRACGGGTQRRVKGVVTPARGTGRCPKPLNGLRYQRQGCNKNACPPDPVCSAKMDIVFVVDASGSWTEKGYKVVKDFLAGLVSRYQFGKQNVKMAVVEFSKEAFVVQTMTFDQKAMLSAVSGKLQFRRGLTDMAKGLLAAEKVLLDGRKDAQSEVIVITDGKPSFKFATSNAATKLRRAGARLVFMPVRTYGSSPFLTNWATHPGKENVFRVPAGLAELKSKMKDWQTKMVVSTCPTVKSAILEKASAAAAR